MIKIRSQKLTSRSFKGLSLIEILIVVTIFSVLGVIVTQSIIISLQGSKKSEGTIIVRENLDYAVGIIERQLRNANSITCPNSAPYRRIDYVDQYGRDTYFRCITQVTPQGNVGYIASGSATARLTTPSVSVSCNNEPLRCNLPDTDSNPSYVDVVLNGSTTTQTGVQSSSITKTTRIYLRNY